MIARTASFQHISGDFAAIAEALRCDYVVENSLRPGEHDVHVATRLVDARNGICVWARDESFRTKEFVALSGQFALEIANDLAGVHGAVVRAERRYARRRPVSELTAYENYLIGMEYEEQYSADADKLGLEHMERALDEDPHFARAHLLRGYLLERLPATLENSNPDEWLAKALEEGEEARRLDPLDPHILSFYARHKARDSVTEAADIAIRAGDLADNEAHSAFAAASSITLVCGAFDEAERLLDITFALNPDPPPYYGFARGRNLLFSGRYEEAEAAVAAAPDFESTYVIRCLAQGLQGKREDAQRTRDQLFATCPGFTFEGYPATMGMVSDACLDVYKAGVESIG